MGVFSNMRRSLFGQPLTNDTKRATAWEDYGYPQELSFENYWQAFERGGLAKAGIMRTVEKCWETLPWVVEGDESDKPHSEWTPWEKQVSKLARQTHLFRRLRSADWRGRIGRYGAIYLAFDDGLYPNQPVAGGKRKLLKIQPLLESQLTPTEWVNNPARADHGMPAMYQFNQTATGNDDPGQSQSFSIHPDRIHIIAEGADDGGLYGLPALSSGFNSLLTLEKLIGAGGEGFWKAARGAFALSGEVKADDLAAAYGVKTEELAEKLDETIRDFASGFDKGLMLGGMKADSLSFSVPTPVEFFNIAMYDYAASLSCPVPILIGQQISQRSSDENSQEWAQTNMSRRKGFLGPNIEDLLRKVMKFGVIDQRDDFHVQWDDLCEASDGEKLDNSKKMSEINKNAAGTGEPMPFSANEIREKGGFESDDDLEDDGYGEGAATGGSSLDKEPGANDPSNQPGTQAA